jgi:YD repeat-containing protein
VTKFIWNSGTGSLSYGYSTYVGGPSSEYGYAIAVDSIGQAYIAGDTSGSYDFPTQNPLQVSCKLDTSGFCGDIFVTKLSATGNTAIYSTYLGGSDQFDHSAAIAADSAGNAYITGNTHSKDFPIAAPLQAQASLADEAFVSKINANGSALVYSTYIGAKGDDWGSGIAVDTAGSALSYSTYLGGSKDERGFGVAVDSASGAYITGFTTASDFPTNGPQQATSGGGYDAFIAKLNASSRIKDITFEGGSLTDLATGVDSTTGASLDVNAAIKGVDGARIPNNTTYLEQNFVGTEDLYMAFYVRLNALPSSDARIAMISNAGTTYGNIVLRSNGTLRLRNNSTQVGSDSALALQPKTLYRIGLHQKRGSGSNAVLEAFVVQGDNLFGTPFASLTNGTWTTKADRTRLGATNGNAIDLWLDDISLDNAAMPQPTLPQPLRIARYGYDGLQRLTGAQESVTPVYTYTYDLAGNRTAVQLNGGTPTTTTYNAANQITNAGFSYDNAGNLINDGTATYSYDALNRTTARGSTTYAYNGDGTLVSQTASSVTTRYTQDLAAPLTQVLQTKVGSAAQTDYIYGLSRLASLQSGVKTWYVADALGSVRRTVTDAGVPLGVINYDPWGRWRAGVCRHLGLLARCRMRARGW